MIYNLSTSPYVLRTLDGHERNGLLLKIEDPDHNVGYSSLFTWPQFGDPSLEECINELRSNKKNVLVYKSLQFALMDLKGDKPPAEIIKNHYHYLDGDIPTQFKIAKRKIGPEITTWPQLDIQWRLDANNRFATGDDFLRYWKTIPEHIRSRVDFVEDPCPFNPREWGKLANINLAWDWQDDDFRDHLSSFEVVVYKPARDQWQHFDWSGINKKILVTSYLDHPIGQLSALAEAQAMKKILGSMIIEAGIYSHPNYESNVYAQRLQTRETQILFPHEKHWGMSDILANLLWSKLGDVSID